MKVVNVDINQFISDKPVRVFSTGSYFFITTKGDILITIDNISKQYSAQNLFFLEPGHELSLSSIGSTFLYDFIEFTLTEDEKCRFENLEVPRLPFNPPNATEIQALVKIAYHLFYSGDRYFDEKLSGHMKIIIYNCASGDEENTANSRKESINYLMRRLRLIIFDNPTSITSVDAGAKYVGLSRSRFQHLYQASFHTSFSQDLIRAKMRRACSLLQSTDNTISKIAEDLGYTYDVYFYQQFKKEIGVSPTVYRKTTNTIF